MAEHAPRAFICGHPVAHSRSPVIHGFWLKRHGLAGSYEKRDVAPEDFARFLETFARDGWAGGNVTLPHKEAAHALVSRRDAAAEAIGAVNTLWVEDGRVVGGNTDAPGFAANLDSQVPGWDRSERAVVLGAGGAARAVLFALQERGIRDIRLVNRTFERARVLADRFGAGITVHGLEAIAEVASDAGLMVNTTSLGMKGNGEMAADPALLPDGAIVSDLVYIPLMTPLLRAAEARGLRISDGLGMLLNQAAPAFEKWFGLRPEVTQELRALVVADIAAAA